MVTLFGIPNCDTVKKARRWLEQHQIDYQFHDFRRDGLDRGLIQVWLTEVEWTDLLNQRSRTWRDLDAAMKQDLSKARAIKLMIDNPSIIKRPILAAGKRLLIGFNKDEYQQKLT